MAEYCHFHNYCGSFFPHFDAYDYFEVGFFDDFWSMLVLASRCMILAVRCDARNSTGPVIELNVASRRNGIRVLLRSCYGHPACGHAARKGMESHPVFNSDEQLPAVLAKLEECRSVLAASGNHDSAHLVSVAVLDVRMKLNRVGDAELKLLCDAMAARGPVEEQGTTSSDAPVRRALLRLVK